MLILFHLLLLSCLTPLLHPPLHPSLQSLTSLFYGEQSEKEKSPSESSPLDADNKDVVSAGGWWLWQREPRLGSSWPSPPCSSPEAQVRS